MAESPRSPEFLTRRGVVAAAGGAGLAAVLTACGGSGSSSDDSASDTASAGAGSGGSSAPSDTSTGTQSPSGSGGSGGTPLGKTSDVPVGGGKIYDAQKVVVTQPTAGTFKCFSAVCTHQGCTVAQVSGGVIHCPCHGSGFHIADGSVANGPATAPLPAKQVTVSGGEITLA
ncbi:Rieske (2Fe-2S) protein [Actinacidiphila guanduensis]|jgi:Rieske Fe-S protein|uniref:Cytochrome bc1 complex Rieske iron-sulfur subunit n=1 Tax=Actinacidiphila guanduensis TaxID=310781 RepID=A0A1H0MNX4_9ACTN|nr:Rieske (2Fe-2S) protein [Actinacidiphila guanduensis]SDO82077.1 Ferredoxin subunit of nitrite reductase or a ring-hydroxylating dioxygenase [Actinacidiphila guanduensis]